MISYNTISFFIVFLCCTLLGCSPNNSTATAEALYEKTIFTDNPSQPKIKEGDQVSIYYCLKNGTKIITSSAHALEPTIITIPNDDALDKFQRPLTWLGLGDSCIVHINVEDAAEELESYKEHFKSGEKATFIYKVLKID
ncbi:hypothetical protein [Aureispira anguillae]|uniref:Peptidylprolyl isomerase n=1 Tax=Aureispira anguillae TaxID=2864201 RepID=A0A916DW10_9BACT|nr:hypothetical protein [Aureispira anguillae]BDS13616.1 hypothetical protein AsAng_0043550 [Aureispira anguillae]